MTAPVFLADDVAGDRIVLAGPEGHHAATVRRVRVGEEVHLVDGRGTRAWCTVAAVAHDVVELLVVRRTSEPPPSPRVVLVQALAKGDRGELAVELATEVGVDEVVPWSAERCIVQWVGQRGEKALRRWRSTAREAGKQSRRAWLPVVRDLHTTSELLELVRSAALTLVLHESAQRPLAGLELPDSGDVLLVVGPEGGLTDHELGVLTTAGATTVRLGHSVLRTSTAGAAAVAVVSAQTSRWR
ncbi:MAG: rRNA (uracil1498-N3)-methyltransferase [Actinomycetota bacterium]|jgi:16S rRNA (uracil1498-N3)-methyltransferase|nr:rRNA (uracil1498-N3)-methyltransferase [Actinomycetota bacterium]